MYFDRNVDDLFMDSESLASMGFGMDGSVGNWSTRLWFKQLLPSLHLYVCIASSEGVHVNYLFNVTLLIHLTLGIIIQVMDFKPLYKLGYEIFVQVIICDTNLINFPRGDWVRLCIPVCFPQWSWQDAKRSMRGCCVIIFYYIQHRPQNMHNVLSWFALLW